VIAVIIVILIIFNMQKITAIPNETKNGFTFPSEYNKATLLEWMKKYRLFEIKPIVKRASRCEAIWREGSYQRTANGNTK